MRRFVCLKLCCCLLSAAVLLATMQQTVYAQVTYTVEARGQTVSVYPAPYSDGGDIMVPFRALTEALGGIWLNVPIGKAHKVAILNDLALYIIADLNVQIIMPLTDDISYDAFSEAETLDDYIPIIIGLMYDGTILVEYFDYQIVEKAGDVYLPLSEFASGLDLDYSVNENAITFDSSYIDYQPSSFNVTFQLDVPNNKTYDGEPITWSQDALKVFCNGTQVTDYLPLTFDCSCLNWNNEMQFISSQPKDAGSYALAVHTNPRDPKYSGTGYFNFIIYPAELILTAEDAEISVGDPLPSFSYNISGIVPGETKADAIIVDPVLTAGRAAEAGSYPIEITGGTAGKNYMIKDRRSGILTISSKLATIPSEVLLKTCQVQCIDQTTGRTLKMDKQQAEEGSSLVITAPDLNGYQVSGPKARKILVSNDITVIFYYTKVTKQEEIPNREEVSDQAEAPKQEEVSKQEDNMTTAVYRPYITGYSNGTFRPQDPIKRNAYAVMLYRLMQQAGSNGISLNQAREFTDVPMGAWYHDAVSTLAAKGIISGYSDGAFRPGKAVTRAEFVVLALRFAQIPIKNAERQFSDVPTSHWAANYIETAVKNGFISGYSDGSFRPEQQITRAAAVTILNRVSGRDQCIVADNISSFSDVPPDFWAYQSIMLAANQSISR